MNSKLCILILAAGASRRMQKVKQLLPWGKTSLVRHVVSNALATKSRSTFIVLGAFHQKITDEIRGEKVSILLNEHHELGISSSIAVGVSGILKKEQPSGILIMLSDQPFISSDYLDEMIDAFKKKNKGIVSTDYGDKIGVPAVFGAEYFQELQHLTGDKGAAQLISASINEGIALKAGKAVQDIDTIEDYLKHRPADSPNMNF
ncbi:MAG: nucleotidyltransferase family protein [Flavobacteriaceae bacterium]